MDRTQEFDPCPNHQRGGQWACHGPEHVAGPFQAVGATVVRRFDGIRQKVVLERSTEKRPPDPGDASQQTQATPGC